MLAASRSTPSRPCTPNSQLRTTTHPLLQVLALVACEKPLSLHPDDVRDAKTQVLRCLRPPALADVVLGQYVAGGGQPGYRDDPSVPPGSQVRGFGAGSEGVVGGLVLF